MGDHLLYVHNCFKKIRCNVNSMKKMLTLALALLGSTYAANSGLDILNQPLDWSTILQNKLAAQGSLFRPLSIYPRDDLLADDALRAAEPQIAGVFGSAPYQIPATKLYQPLVLWGTCPFDKLGERGQAPYLASVMKNVGYKLIAQKTSEADQVALWQPINKAYPKVATAFSWKCATSLDDKDLTTLVIYQVGEARHLAFYGEDYRRMAGVTQQQANTPQVTVKSPTGPTRPNRDNAILVELYNPNKVAVDVKVKVIVRDASGKPINVYINPTVFHVEPNSPFQAMVPVNGAGAFDAIISVIP